MYLASLQSSHMYLPGCHRAGGAAVVRSQSYGLITLGWRDSGATGRLAGWCHRKTSLWDT
jgi:hypothetical protein